MTSHRTLRSARLFSAGTPGTATKTNNSGKKRRRQVRIRPSVGEGPVIDGFDVLGPLLYLSMLGILLFELVAVA